MHAIFMYVRSHAVIRKVMNQPVSDRYERLTPRIENARYIHSQFIR